MRLANAGPAAARGEFLSLHLDADRTVGPADPALRAGTWTGRTATDP